MRRRKKISQRELDRLRSRSRISRRHKRDMELQIDEGIAKEIWAVMYLALGILTVMSIQGQLGVVGIFWQQSLAPIFGYGLYAVPVILFGLAIALFFIKSVHFGLARSFGLILLVTSALGIIHLSVPEVDIYDAAAAGKYGGLIGFVASFIFRMILGLTGAYVTLLAFFLISLLLTFEVSLFNLLALFGFVFSWPAMFFSSKKRRLVSDKKAEDRLSAMTDVTIVKPEALSEHQPSVLLKEVIKPMETEEIAEDEEEDSPAVAVSFKQAPVEYVWQPPALELLSDAVLRVESNDLLLKKNAELIRNKLLQFGVEVTMHDVNVGPTVMQYTLRPHAGVKLSKITSLKNDLALALAAKAVRIEAPIPGKSLVGIEIPNDIRSTVHLREILESKEWHDFPGQIKLPLGRDVTGKPIIGALEKMPHLLIAGATGSGKSVAINTLLLSLFYQFTPRELKLILVDPKRVELNNYNSIPYLLTPVVTDVERAAIALRWAVKEMTRRYQVCAESAHRNIDDYNNDDKIREKMPKIVVIIDELADLMMTTGKEVEASICRLAQMARAVGIYLIVATQRPSVDVVTGLIKANIPARIAFTMSSSIDSRTVLDMTGAEDLIGHGDMLYLSGTMSKAQRVQGVFVSSQEIERVTTYLKTRATDVNYDDTIISDEMADSKVQGLPDSVLKTTNDDALSDDQLYHEALRFIMEHRKASASLLQRRLSIGYARAARLLDMLEEKGVIGPARGAKPRDILGIGS